MAHLDNVLVLFSGRARVIPRSEGFDFRTRHVHRILKVGAVPASRRCQSVLTITIFTACSPSFGPQVLASYGIGARLDSC